VILSILLSSGLDASSRGVGVVGAVERGFPPVGPPEGTTWAEIPKVPGIAGIDALVATLADATNDGAQLQQKLP
jgi:hypothetical protein